MDDLITEFIAETREMLEALERGLVAWERDPNERERLAEIFRFVHTVKGNCGFFDLPRLEALAHAAEDALGEVRAGRRVADSALVDAVLAVIDRIGEMIEVVAVGGDITGGNDADLIARLAAVETVVEPAVQPVVDPGEPAGPARSVRADERQGSVRLPTTLVDRVMSGVSDMVLVRNELERQLRLDGADPALLSNFGRLSSLLADLQAAMAQARMLPIGTLLGSYQRMVRDLSAELGKQVELDVESGQVDLDREMIELLRDPLLHIVRNAIDHGIETPDVRVAAGKRPGGRLLLSARQTGNEIRIAVMDDGRGIDADKVVERAVSRGVITAEQALRLDQSQKLALICEPGLSTADAVTQISGRGVGMDVVRASIERIGGKLRILSTPGEGSRFLLDVPLTLSIVPSITVVAGGQVFAVPRSYVREIVRNDAEIEVEPIGGMRHVRVRGNLHPCIDLAEVLETSATVPPLQQVLVMMTMIDGSIFALAVDAIADHCELVIRPVAQQIIATGLYVGVAQLNDGRPALMLDVAGLSRISGLSYDQHARIGSTNAANAADVQADLVPMILFDGLDGQRRAVAMDQVERLLEVARADIGQGGGHPHIIFEDQIVPLYGLVPDCAAESIDVLVVATAGVRQAHATAGRIDTAEIDLATVTGKPGNQLVLHDGQSLELLDPAWFGSGVLPAAPVCRLPSDDPWCREVLRPLVESAGYRVTEDDERFVDLEIIVDPTDERARMQKAGDVLVVAEQARRGKAARAGLTRDDHANLLNALLASQRKAS